MNARTPILTLQLTKSGSFKSTILEFPNSKQRVFTNPQQIGNANVDLKIEIQMFEEKFLKDLSTRYNWASKNFEGSVTT